MIQVSHFGDYGFNGCQESHDLDGLISLVNVCSALPKIHFVQTLYHKANTSVFATRNSENCNFKSFYITFEAYLQKSKNNNKLCNISKKEKHFLGADPGFLDRGFKFAIKEVQFDQFTQLL